MKKVINWLDFIFKYGIHEFLRKCFYRLTDIYYEKYFNVNTTINVSNENFGISHHESHHYSSVHYKHIFTVLDKLPVDKNKSTLLDYGCGEGRVIITAAAYQYKKIIGIELSRSIDIAKNNIAKMKHRKTNNIELIQCDAMDFRVPSDVNIIYFYNPFWGSILENVTRNIYSSYKDTQRKIYIIYFNNDYFDKVITHEDWLTKIDQSEVFQNISCGLYETNL